MGFVDSLQHAWNAFRGREMVMPPTVDLGASYGYRPDRYMLHPGVERSIVTSVINRIAMDVASIPIRHVLVDENDRYVSTVKSGLNNCLSIEANIDQTGVALIQDIVMSLCDEGCIAVVPVETSVDINQGAFQINQLRVGKIMQWYPKHVQVRLYNEETGNKQDIIVPKAATAIIENPLYAVMNEPNSTLRRLIRKLNILDAIDEQSGSGKLDLIIQLPYVVRSPVKKAQAEQRRKDIEAQLAGSKYGIAYTDGTERITQLNRPTENNLMNQITYLTTMLYGQLGITEEVFTGKADEATMINYRTRTIKPFLKAICDEFKRKFLTKTARTQGHSIMYFSDAFDLVPSSQIADIAAKFISSEILTPNEVRGIIGFKPSDDTNADELRNRNTTSNTGPIYPQSPEEEEVVDDESDYYYEDE